MRKAFWSDCSAIRTFRRQNSITGHPRPRTVRVSPNATESGSAVIRGSCAEAVAGSATETARAERTASERRMGRPVWCGRARSSTRARVVRRRVVTIPRMHEIKVGVQVQPQHADYDAMRSAWTEAEALGVDMVFTWDHFFPLYGEPDGKHFESLALQ